MTKKVDKTVNIFTAKMMYILGKYTVVDGNRIIAKNLEEVEELVQSGISSRLGVRITYAHEAKINEDELIQSGAMDRLAGVFIPIETTPHIATKIIDMIKKYKYFLIALFFVISLLLVKTVPHSTAWENCYMVTIAAHLYLTTLTFRYSRRLTISPHCDECDSFTAFCAHNAFWSSIVAYVICVVWYTANLAQYFSN